MRRTINSLFRKRNILTTDTKITIFGDEKSGKKEKFNKEIFILFKFFDQTNTLHIHANVIQQLNNSYVIL